MDTIILIILQSYSGSGKVQLQHDILPLAGNTVGLQTTPRCGKGKWNAVIMNTNPPSKCSSLRVQPRVASAGSAPKYPWLRLLDNIVCHH